MGKTADGETMVKFPLPRETYRRLRARAALTHPSLRALLRELAEGAALSRESAAAVPAITQPAGVPVPSGGAPCSAG